MNLPKIFINLKPVDALFIAFSQILSLISCFFFPGTPTNVLMVVVNLGVAGCILWLAKASVATKYNIVRLIRHWYPVPAIFFIFKEVHYTIQALGCKDWDSVLIAVDRSLFGLDPTVWLSRFSSPLVTEVLQIAYTSYYFIMLAVALELFRRKKNDNFDFFAFTIVYGFVLSYFGYLIFPGVGPRFTLHDFHLLDRELPGVWLTSHLRDYINAGESIPKNVIDPIAFVQRDVFPSGHTQMTLLSMYYAHRYKLSSRFLVDTLGVLLILGTVYLRYHYGVDVIAGVFFALFTVWSAENVFRWWNNILKG